MASNWATNRRRNFQLNRKYSDGDKVEERQPKRHKSQGGGGDNVKQHKGKGGKRPEQGEY